MTDPGTPDPIIELAGSVAGLLFELRIAAAAISLGLDTLAAKPETVLVREELNVLRKMAGQSSDALEALQRAITEHLSPAGE
jgi:hypothetical protein